MALLQLDDGSNHVRGSTKPIEGLRITNPGRGSLYQKVAKVKLPNSLDHDNKED